MLNDPIEFFLHHAGTAFDALVRGLAGILDRMAAEKRFFFHQIHPHRTAGQGVGGRQTGDAAADDQNLFICPLQSSVSFRLESRHEKMQHGPGLPDTVGPMVYID